MDASRFEIDNRKAIGRLRPWFLPGRNVPSFLLGAAHPLAALHGRFLDWALETMIEAKTTSQPKSLVWYLNHKFRKHFADSTSSFAILYDLNEVTGYVYFKSEYDASTDVSSTYPWSFNAGETVVDNTKNEMRLTARYIDEEVGDSTDTVLLCPTINTTADYTQAIYETEVKAAVDKYMTTKEHIEYKFRKAS